MKTMTAMIAIVAVLMIFPVISADVIMQEIDETSGIIIEGNLDVELRNATVEINLIERYLKATFEVYSNEEEKINTKVYLKAKGQECYGGCIPIEVVEETFFNINSPYDHYTLGPEDGEFTSDFAKIYETEDGKFASVDFILKPGKNEIKIYQPIGAPFEYYLDSLSTFTKADYEKITIKGENLEVTFNEDYPVEKISDNEWVWEYSDLDVTDEKLKDILIIKQLGSLEPTPHKLVYYIFGAIILILLIIIGSLLKKIKSK